jgi:hypothetical protein
MKRINASIQTGIVGCVSLLTFTTNTKKRLLAKPMFAVLVFCVLASGRTQAQPLPGFTVSLLDDLPVNVKQTTLAAC